MLTQILEENSGSAFNNIISIANIVGKINQNFPLNVNNLDNEY